MIQTVGLITVPTINTAKGEAAPAAKPKAAKPGTSKTVKKEGKSDD